MNQLKLLLVYSLVFLLVLSGIVPSSGKTSAQSSSAFIMENGEIKRHTLTIDRRAWDFRSIFNSTFMKSPYVKSVTDTGSTFTVNGGGWGHGIGMSQFGAYQMSTEGHSYQNILNFYYPGAQITTEQNRNVNIRLSNYLGNRTEVPVLVTGEYTIDGVQTLNGSHNYSIKIENGLLALYRGNERIRTGSTLNAVPKEYGADNVIRINGRPYIGTVRFAIEGGFIRPVVTLQLEDYLKGVVPHEMSAGWGNHGGLEALKAQAVAARTYILRFGSATVTDTQSHQVYGGHVTFANTNQAVDSTRGEALRHNGGLIEALYSSSNGGKILSNTNSWGSGLIPYLITNDDPYDLRSGGLGNGNINWNFSLHKTQIDLSGRNLSNPGQWWSEVSERDVTLTNNIKTWIRNQGLVDSHYEMKIVGIDNISFTTNFTSNQRINGSMSVSYILRDTNEPLYNLTLTSSTPLYDQIGGSPRSEVINPQVVTVYQESNGWYQINTWLGRKWINPTFAIEGEPNSVSQRLTLTQDTRLHDGPFAGQRRSEIVKPQTVTAIAEWNGWYQINTWLGPKWINPTNVLIGEPNVINERLLLTTDTRLHDQPLDSARRNDSVRPQQVTATAEWDGWYRINTWLGPKWIKSSNATVWSPNNVSVRITLTEDVRLHNQPLANTSRSEIVRPQTVTGIQEWNGWYLINTWVGQKWIKPNNAIIGEPTPISERIRLTEDARLHNSPSESSRRSEVVRPQTVTAVAEWNGWYLINTWVGQKWIKPNNAMIGEPTPISEQIVLTETVHLHNLPFENTRRSEVVRPQTVTAVAEWNGWYLIKTWVGDKWIKPSNVTFASSSIVVEEKEEEKEEVIEPVEEQQQEIDNKPEEVKQEKVEQINEESKQSEEVESVEEELANDEHDLLEEEEPVKNDE
ncbi:SpoIID/LytB domain-containing protein [Alkalihalobacterium alkalinitrilicum]|uniref:SpoIID/LytB domain-containing protein n=1 Tax=Alkalihalobacterium alkalinitrilicum TaxID=427920 RepID=UPI000994FBF6|nr:SpoIID/LytB domain-containing protein [Alkalihalobacterium alkalinitrilicum]